MFYIYFLDFWYCKHGTMLYALGLAPVKVCNWRCSVSMIMVLKSDNFQVCDLLYFWKPVFSQFTRKTFIHDMPLTHDCCNRYLMLIIKGAKNLAGSSNIAEIFKNCISYKKDYLILITIVLIVVPNYFLCCSIFKFLKFIFPLVSNYQQLL